MINLRDIITKIRSLDQVKASEDAAHRSVIALHPNPNHGVIEKILC